MQSKLYIVGTPIGNLGDLSQRAIETLKEVDVVLCEDTRVTAKLLSASEIKIKTETIHQHSTDKELSLIVDRIAQGENMAFVSDAGTPGISDPGGKLVAVAIKSGIEIIPIPGASAVTTALSVCAFPSDTFTFLGFPPNKKGRLTFFGKIDEIEHTVVLFESKHRIIKTLEQLPDDRLMMVGRELTKMHETLYRGTSQEIIDEIEASSSKGEFVIVLAPKKWK